MFINHTIIAKLKEDFPNDTVELVDSGKSIKVNHVVLYLNPNWGTRLEMFHNITDLSQKLLYEEIKEEAVKTIAWEKAQKKLVNPPTLEDVMASKKKAEVETDPLLEDIEKFDSEGEEE